MHRFFVAERAVPGDALTFRAGMVRQMTRVLRLGPGARVVAVDPDGWELTVEINRVRGREVEGLVVARERPRREPVVQVTVAQGLPRGEKFDLVVQKCTEIGATAILPVIASRSVGRLEGKEGPRRERWQRIAREAAEQAGRTVIPEVGPICTLAEAVERLAAADLFVVPWEEESARGLRSLLRGTGQPRSVGVLIGPEGGLAPEEVELARRHGALPVTLGPRLLRTETAGLVALAMIFYEFGDMG